MSTVIPADLEPFVEEIIRRGVCRSADDVVAEALRIYQEIDRRRPELRASIEAGLASETVSGDVVFSELDRLANQFAAKN